MSKRLIEVRLSSDIVEKIDQVVSEKYSRDSWVEHLIRKGYQAITQ